MKNFIKISLSLLVILFVFSCKKDNNNGGFNPGKNNYTYAGNATTTIDYYEFDPWSGQDVFIEQKTYNFNVDVFVKPPLQVGSIAESNPFNLQITPHRVKNDEEGHIDISSGLIITDILTGDVLLQYWNINLNNSQFTGNLFDNHKAEAAATNMIWAWDDVAGITMTMPFYMANGANMTGTINGNSISLNIQGQSTDTYRRFTAQINANIQ